MINEDTAAIVQAIRDLTRVTLLLHGDLNNNSEAVRKLHDLGVEKNSIAAILGMAPKDISSVLIKAEKSQKVHHEHD